MPAMFFFNVGQANLDVTKVVDDAIKLDVDLTHEPQNEAVRAFGHWCLLGSVSRPEWLTSSEFAAGDFLDVDPLIVLSNCNHRRQYWAICSCAA